MAVSGSIPGAFTTPSLTSCPTAQPPELKRHKEGMNFSSCKIKIVPLYSLWFIGQSPEEEHIMGPFSTVSGKAAIADHVRLALPIICSMVILTGCLSRIMIDPTDADLREVFEDHEQEFETLRDMISEDSYYGVGFNFVDHCSNERGQWYCSSRKMPDISAVLAYVKLDPDRYRSYKRLLKKVRARGVLLRSSSEVNVLMTGKSACVTKTLVWTTTPPSTLANDTEVDGEKPGPSYAHLRDDWYIERIGL